MRWLVPCRGDPVRGVREFLSPRRVRRRPILPSRFLRAHLRPRRLRRRLRLIWSANGSARPAARRSWRRWVQRASRSGTSRSRPGTVPGAEGPEAVEDPAEPCRDAVPLRHSHFFTEDGQFGSRDQDGNQVDEGTYRIVDEGSFVVSKEFPDITFHYSIDGDQHHVRTCDSRVQP